MHDRVTGVVRVVLVLGDARVRVRGFGRVVGRQMGRGPHAQAVGQEDLLSGRASTGQRFVPADADYVVAGD